MFVVRAKLEVAIAWAGKVTPDERGAAFGAAVRGAADVVPAGRAGVGVFRAAARFCDAENDSDEAENRRDESKIKQEGLDGGVRIFQNLRRRADKKDYWGGPHE